MSQLQRPEKLSNCPQRFEYIYKHSYGFIDHKATKKAEGQNMYNQQKVSPNLHLAVMRMYEKMA